MAQTLQATEMLHKVKFLEINLEFKSGGNVRLAKRLQKTSIVSAAKSVLSPL
jgi:hypothetical protein